MQWFRLTLSEYQNIDNASIKSVDWSDFERTGVIWVYGFEFPDIKN